MNAEVIAAIQAGRLDFQGLLNQPFRFGDSPSMNSAATREVELASAEAAVAEASKPAQQSAQLASWGVTDPQPAKPAAKRTQTRASKAQQAAGVTIARGTVPAKAWADDDF